MCYTHCWSKNQAACTMAVSQRVCEEVVYENGLSCREMQWWLVEQWRWNTTCRRTQEPSSQLMRLYLNKNFITC